MIIYSNDTGPIIFSPDERHDPDSKKFYRLDYRPPVRLSSSSYIKDKDVVILSIDDGCMYECVSGGRTFPTEPEFSTVASNLTKDGTVIWKTIPYSSRLSYNDTIVESTWTSNEDIILTNSILVDGSSTLIRVDYVNPSLEQFTITNHIVVEREDSLVEEFDKSLTIQVAQL